MEPIQNKRDTQQLRGFDPEYREHCWWTYNSKILRDILVLIVNSDSKMLIKLLLVLKMRKKSIKFYIFNTLVGELYIVAEGCRWGTIYCGRRLSLGNYILWQKIV